MTFRRRLTAQEPLLGAWIGIPAPALIEGLGRADLDFVILDLEHGEFGIEERLPDLIRAAENTKIVPLVRLPSALFGLAGRILDAGAQGFLIPQLEDPEIVTRVVESTAFPPTGKRGVSTFTRAGKFGAFTISEVMNGEDSRPVVLGQIESQVALNALPAILGAKALDGIIIGLNDLAAAMGIGEPSSGPELDGIVHTIVQATRREEIAVGCVCADLAAAQRFLRMGISILVLSSGLLWRAYADLAQEIRRLNAAPGIRDE